jgi:hypothetical protein
VETVYCIDKDGQWAEQVFAAEEDGFTLNREFPFTEPLCLLLK